ncbi:MAG: thiamine-phosphate kinase [Thiobacillaceae bacterium]|nr:thiamine-phosphate kinase [Thiobacillaceae bacterium]
MPSEFELIARHFSRPAATARLGVGDDAALVAPTGGMELAVSTDMLLAGRHFLPDTDPRLLGHKALAVNLSDLAAMGARPRWALLAIALPRADEAWLAAFSAGLYALAEAHGVELIGGDTSRGPLTLCLTVIGEVPAGRALTRAGARPGDEVWVSGELGAAALGLAHLQGRCRLQPEAAAACLARLHTPAPRVALGAALVGLASAAIDISDGLLADLGHILERSGVGAELEYTRLPAAAALRGCADVQLAQRCLLAGGDDYELVFTAAPALGAAIESLAARLGLPLTRIGRITAGAGLALRDDHGRTMAYEVRGYDHFADGAEA